jgi:hypothetical protein
MNPHSKMVAGERASPIRSWCRFVAEPQSGHGGARLGQSGEDCLADAELPASLRRLLADQLDDLRRALQVRSGAA